MAKLSIEELTSCSMSVIRVVRSCVWATSFCTTENSLLMDFIVWFRRVLWVFRIVMVPFRDFPKVCRAWLWTKSCCRISGISAWISPTCRLTVAKLTALAVFMPMLNRVPTAAAAPSRAPKNHLGRRLYPLNSAWVTVIFCNWCSMWFTSAWAWTRTSRVQRAPAQVVWAAERV